MWTKKGKVFWVVGGTSAATVRLWSLAEGRSKLWRQPQTLAFWLRTEQTPVDRDGRAELHTLRARRPAALRGVRLPAGPQQHLQAVDQATASTIQLGPLCDRGPHWRTHRIRRDPHAGDLSVGRQLKVVAHRSVPPGMRRHVCSATHTHPFNGPFSRTIRWAGTRKVKPIWILLKQDTVSGSGISWAIMQVCTSLQTDYHASTPPLNFLQAGCPSCRPTKSVNASCIATREIL